MKAILLAAGFGTRLRPLTNNIPKCLVPIKGKALLEIWLDKLSDVGVKDFLINTHYLPEKVESFIIHVSIYGDIPTTIYVQRLSCRKSRVWSTQKAYSLRKLLYCTLPTHRDWSGFEVGGCRSGSRYSAPICIWRCLMGCSSKVHTPGSCRAATAAVACTAVGCVLSFCVF